MVTAFEQSLSVMNSRLQQLTSMSERKDVELTRLRNMIDEITCHKKRDPNDSIESSPVKKGDKKSKENKSLLIRRHTFASVNSDGKIDHVKSMNFFIFKSFFSRQPPIESN